eukprot:903624-Amphidinium_carterae.1
MCAEASSDCQRQHPPRKAASSPEAVLLSAEFLSVTGKQKHPPDFCVEASGLLAQQEGDELGEAD